MGNESPAKRSAVVRVFTVLVYLLGAFCVYVVATSVFHLFKNPYENLSPWVNLSLWLDAGFTALFSLAALYQLFRLVQRIANGDPFNAENPKRVRNVAYAVLAVSLSNLVFNYVRDGLMRGLTSELWFAANVLIKGAERVFFILGLLIIAKLLDTGVRLQQDQNLTI